jgi:hypothetical protein
MHIFADAFIPLSPITPVSQVVLLLVIIVLEGSLIRKRLRESNAPRLPFWLRISGANVATAVLGLLLAYPIMILEFALAFGWGSDASHPLLWYTSCALYGIGLPWLVWFLCYHVSWRVEFWLLKKTKGVAANDSSQAKTAVRDAHRWSYALLGLPVLYVTLWYWTTIFHTL